MSTTLFPDRRIHTETIVLLSPELRFRFPPILVGFVELQAFTPLKFVDDTSHIMSSLITIPIQVMIALLVAAVLVTSCSDSSSSGAPMPDDADAVSTDGGGVSTEDGEGQMDDGAPGDTIPPRTGPDAPTDNPSVPDPLGQNPIVVDFDITVPAYVSVDVGRCPVRGESWGMITRARGTTIMMVDGPGIPVEDTPVAATQNLTFEPIYWVVCSMLQESTDCATERCSGYSSSRQTDKQTLSA